MTTLDLLDAAFQSDPHGFLAEQRESGDGVHYQPQSDAWLVHRYGDVHAILRDPAAFSSKWPGRMGRSGERIPPEAAAQMHRSLVFSDPPLHTRLRTLVNKAFNPRAVRRLEAQITAAVDRLLSQLEPGGEIDFVEKIAAPLPVEVIADMLGVEAEDRLQFSEWAHAATTLSAPALDPDVRRANAAAVAAFWRSTRETVADRRARPRDDLVSDLLQVEVDGDSLSDGDVSSTLHVLLIGGFETTRTFFSNFVWLLFRHPEIYDRVRSDPAVLPGAMDEALRLEPPLFFVPRVTAQPARIGTTEVEADQAIVLCVASANRDPRVYDDPDDFVVGRPTPHLSFGFGPHYCIGAPIMRLEAEILLPRLFAKFPNISPGSEPPEHFPMTTARSFSRLPVRLD